MEYYKLLQLEREPFSNSPDPEFYFQTRQHQQCLQKLELALRLKRGLNVVIGDVGTGKTTLCRELIRKFAVDNSIETHLILDPSFATAKEFLNIMAGLLCSQPPDPSHSEIEIKEAIKQSLFHKGVNENKTIVMIIDEGQKISTTSLEILREFLNYETNVFKLLQIAIFAQTEFKETLKIQTNVADRINLLHFVAPLNFQDTCRLIHHRIKLASNGTKPINLFTKPALRAIFRISQGYPRRIINICHQCLLALIIQNRKHAGRALVHSCSKRTAAVTTRQYPKVYTYGALVLAVALIAVSLISFYHLPFEKIPLMQHYELPAMKTEIRQNATPEPEFQQHKLLLPESNPKTASIAQALKIAARNTMPVLPVIPQEPVIKSSLKIKDHEKPLQPVKDTHTGPPETIGRLKVHPGDTLGEMMQKIYGGSLPLSLQTIIDTNTHIHNPNNIRMGDTIHFPAMQVHQTNQKCHECRWIVLAETDTFKSAYDCVANLYSQAIPARIIVTWSVSDEMHFYIAATGYFTTQQSANAYLKALPAAYAANARIVTQWSAIRLLTDPFYGGPK